MILHMICIVFYFTLYDIVKLTKSPRVYAIGKTLFCATHLGSSISVNYKRVDVNYK
jgi:hypothetical protein